MNTQTVKDESSEKASFFPVSAEKRLAYHLNEGKTPGIVFLGGFNSDMTGTKATALETHCRGLGRRFLRFDYSGHGQSSGTFTDGTIGEWADDAVTMLDHVARGPNILVGSSMGGWIMLLAALARKDRVAGLVGIASAPDFTETLLWETASPAQKKELVEKGMMMVPSCDGNAPYSISLKLVEEGRRHLLLSGKIGLDVPVRLVHGLKDEDVPWQVSVQLAESLASADVRVDLVKNAGHRLSEPDHLALIFRSVEEVLSRVKNP